MRYAKTLGIEAAWLAGLATAAVSCGGGTQTGNPVLSFESSGCKVAGHSTALTAVSSEGGVAGVRSALLVDSERYDGLQCFGYELSESGVLTLDVLNMAGGCAIEWDGRVELEAGTARLFVENPRCDVQAACGSCVYDFSFELDGVDAGAPLALELWEKGDCEAAELDAQVTLPLDTESRGMRCRPVDPGVLAWIGQCGGELHHACGAICEPEGACDEGLTCGEFVDGDERCLGACQSDADCPLDGLLRCDEGLCRLDSERAF